MIAWRLLRGAMVGLTLVALLTALHFATSPGVVVSPPQAKLVAVRETLIVRHPVNADSVALIVSGRNPFRPSRAAAGRRYDPLAPAGAPLQPTLTSRPNLTLVGLVLGNDPAALIEGIPGVEGTRVVRPEERVGQVQLRSVGRDNAVVTGFDTTWTLRLRRAGS